jgi:hypothetical protein
MGALCNSRGHRDVETIDDDSRRLEGSDRLTEPLRSPTNEARWPFGLGRSERRPHTMPEPENPAPRSRSAAEAKYRTLRNTAFKVAMRDLAANGVHAELRSIDAAAVAHAAQWKDRRVAWPWHTLAAGWRRNHPNRFEVAVWRDDVLCGLMLGRPAPAAAHFSLHFLEANPDDANPLRGNVTLVTLAAARRYAITLGKTEFRLVDPLPAVVPFYCSPRLGFELVTPAQGEPYYRRSL